MKMIKEDKLQVIKEEHPSKYNLFKKVIDGKASAKQSIKAMCLECVWMDTNAIKNCASTSCPLWHHRPYVPKTK